MDEVYKPTNPRDLSHGNQDFFEQRNSNSWWWRRAQICRVLSIFSAMLILTSVVIYSTLWLNLLVQKHAATYPDYDCEKLVELDSHHKVPIELAFKEFELNSQMSKEFESDIFAPSFKQGFLRCFCE